MHLSTIQASLDELASLLASRGLEPSVELTLHASQGELLATSGPVVIVRFYATIYDQEHFKTTMRFFRGGTVETMLSSAREYILGLPTATQQDENTYREMLASAAAQGKKIGASGTATLLAVLAELAASPEPAAQPLPPDSIPY
jgi:hypothetical protein